MVRAARFDHVDSVRQRRFEFLTKILIDSRRCPIDWLCNDTAQRYGRFVLTPAIAGFTLFAAFEESRFRGSRMFSSQLSVAQALTQCGV